VIRPYNRQGCRHNGAGFPGSGGKTGYLQVSPEKANVSLQGERWGEPVKIVLNGKSQDPASATLIVKGEDLKDFGNITLLSKDVELSPDWKEVSFKLDEGLEYGYALQGGNIIRARCGGIYDPFVG
jgi:hypothetical protein